MNYNEVVAGRGKGGVQKLWYFGCVERWRFCWMGDEAGLYVVPLYNQAAALPPFAGVAQLGLVG